MPDFLYKSSRPALYAAMLLLLAAGFVFGGASRLDVLAPLAVRLAAVAALAYLFWRLPPAAIDPGRGATIIMACLLALPLLQLIPLPWSVWTALPGHATSKGLFELAGLTPAEPLSLTPARTLNAWLALLPPLAIWLLAAALDVEARAGALRLVVLVALFGALLGLAQIGGGPAFYPYAITTAGAAVGLFANANHQALFLCTGMLLSFLWLADRPLVRGRYATRDLVVTALALAAMALSLIFTQSRAGIALAVIAVGAGALIAGPAKLGVQSRRAETIGIAIAVGLVALVVAAEAGAFGEIFRIDVKGNARLTNIPLFVRIAADYLPFGAGLGSFDPVFRSYERIDTLGLNYLNQAHNDYAQIAIEAGLPGLLLIAAFLLWFARAGLAAWRDDAPTARETRQRRAGVVVVVMALLHSAADYPLRAPAMVMVFALALALLSRPAPSVGSARRSAAAH